MHRAQPARSLRPVRSPNCHLTRFSTCRSKNGQFPTSSARQLLPCGRWATSPPSGPLGLVPPVSSDDVRGGRAEPEDASPEQFIITPPVVQLLATGQGRAHFRYPESRVIYTART